MSSQSLSPQTQAFLDDPALFGWEPQLHQLVEEATVGLGVDTTSIDTHGKVQAALDHCLEKLRNEAPQSPLIQLNLKARAHILLLRSTSLPGVSQSRLAS